jgi:hypothetical protein
MSRIRNTALKDPKLIAPSLDMAPPLPPFPSASIGKFLPAIGYDTLHKGKKSKRELRTMDILAGVGVFSGKRPAICNCLPLALHANKYIRISQRYRKSPNFDHLLNFPSVSWKIVLKSYIIFIFLKDARICLITSNIMKMVIFDWN